MQTKKSPHTKTLLGAPYVETIEELDALLEEGMQSGSMSLAEFKASMKAHLDTLYRSLWKKKTSKETLVTMK